ncbi:MAG: DNA/RNA non-specific endonuclease [Lachnospiraceae bacterium]|nr:DNA/RNA non-specific endonuclease [Lachnospiraceae bacterium]
MKRTAAIVFSIFLSVFFAFITLQAIPVFAAGETSVTYGGETIYVFDPESVPEYDGQPYCEINDNRPFFGPETIVTAKGEIYSELDELGRCGVCMALVNKDTMPAGDRGMIGNVQPSGWDIVKYDVIDNNYLYNRCHLIAWQLTGENDNERNLITGTGFLNTEGMIPFESKVASYVNGTGKSVLYRATPVFDGDDLVAKGVLLEAYSIEDNGASVCFNVFCYNVQPGISINYSTGSSSLEKAYGDISDDQTGFLDLSSTDAAEDTAASSVRSSIEESVAEPAAVPATTAVYIGNKNTMKFHYDWCNSVDQMKEKNKVYFEPGTTPEEIKARGYSPCGNCHP